MALIVLRKEFGITRQEAAQMPVWERNLFVDAGKKIMGVDAESVKQREIAESAAKANMPIDEYKLLMGDD